MEESNYLIIFGLEDQRFALRIPIVDRVLRAVEITPLARAPAIILGIINVEGKIIPVINGRKLFNVPDREIELSDQLIIVHLPHQMAAILVDTVYGVVPYPEEEMVSAAGILPGTPYMESVIRLEEGIVLLYHLDQFLSLEDVNAFQAALSAP